MQRRTFLKTSVASSLALTTIPSYALKQETIYSVEELMGKEAIPLYGEGVQLREESCNAYLAMKKAAYTAGFDMKLVSGYRDYYRQEAIWNRKYVKYTDIQGLSPTEAIAKIVEYSTIPGTSRHHWATEVDIIDGYPKTSGDVLVPEKFEAGGPFEGFKKWLDKNANTYGFHLVYTDNYFRKGFKYEPWHYSYAPLSKPMLKQYRKVNILKHISSASFEGSEHLTRSLILDYIHDNILDINPYLL